MLNKIQKELCSTAPHNYSDIKCLILNCTLKKSPKLSHTSGIINISKNIMEKVGVKVETLRPVDYDIPPGVWPDMTKKGYKKDDWPKIFKKVMKDISLQTN